MSQTDVRESNVPDEHVPHLSYYFHVVTRWRWIMVSVPLVVVLSTLFLLQVRRPIYRSECQVLLWATPNIVLPGSAEYFDPTLGASAGGSPMVRQFLETQYRLILSRPNIEKTFYKMGFANREPFAEAADPIEMFRKRFSVRGSRNSFLAVVAFEWEDPEEARDALAVLVDYYIESVRTRAVGETQKGLDELALQAVELRQKVGDKSDELHRFMREHNTVSLEREQNIIGDRLRRLNTQLSDVEARRIEAESRFANIRDALVEKRPLEDLPEVLDSQTVRDLKLEHVRMRLLCSDLENSLGPNHPQVRAAQATLSAIGEKLRVEVLSVLATAESEYTRALKQETEIGQALAEQKQAVTEFNELEGEYSVLKEEFATLQNAYRDVENRRQEMAISMPATRSNTGVFISEPASLPVKPAKPRKKLSLALAVLFGMALGTGLSFFADYLDTSIKTKEEVEALTGSAVLGYVPALQNGQMVDGEKYAGPLELAPLKRPMSVVAETFRSIRTALSFTRTNSQCHQFAVTSALPSEGKTLVSVNIAMALAQTGKKVLLVDGDLRWPRIHKLLGIERSPGLSNLLAGDESFTIDDVAVKPNMETLSVIPSGPIPPNPAELFSGPRMGELLRTMAERFDYVLFDTPPAINVTDSAVLAQRVSGALLVVRAFVTDKAAITRVRDLFKGADVRLLGVVMNGVDAPRTGYKYEGYYYHSNYYEYGDENGAKKKRRPRSGKSPVKTS